MSETIDTLGWFVVGVLDNDKKGKPPHMISRVYQSRQAADDFAELCRRQLKQPELVEVRTKYAVAR